MRDNYPENKRIPLGRWRAVESGRAGHKRMAGKHFWESGWCLGLAAVIAVFPLRATDRVGSDHAHRHDFTRRQSQPASLTQHPNCDMVKVTAFDMARITDPSMTADASL